MKELTGQPRRITLMCPPELKLRLMWRLTNWAADDRGELDPGIEVHVPRRDRHDYDQAQPYTAFSIPLGLFVAHGDPPLRSQGQTIEWWRAPWTFFISEIDLEGAVR